jgi:hypothetical protein
MQPALFYLREIPDQPRCQPALCAEQRVRLRKEFLVSEVGEPQAVRLVGRFLTA